MKKKERKFDRAEINRLLNDHSVKEVAQIMGCSVSLVKVVKEEGTLPKTTNMDVYQKKNRPILLEEISRYRENLQIGQKIRLEYTEEYDFKKINRIDNFVVTEKSTWFFTAQNARGHRETRTYQEMIVKEREKQNADKITG